MARTGKPVGPLHGLPISLKDNFNLAGLDSTVGFVSHIGDPAAHDATLAQLLADAGAVFYVKTNVPTAMMIAESVNNVFGRTVNPLNRRLTSGGSSGGESALIAFKGSPWGVGTDIGGSVSKFLYSSLSPSPRPRLPHSVPRFFSWVASWWKTAPIQAGMHGANTDARG